MGQRVSDRDLTAVLVRHGETAWNRDGRVQGWAPVGLTDRGRRQARALGRHLASAYDFDAVVASDLRRARETAVRLHDEGVDPAPTYSLRWRERDFGVYQGLSQEALFGAHPEFRATAGAMGARAIPEGGESLLALRERVLAGWEQLLERNGSGTVLAVTHGGPIYALLGHVRGMALSAAFRDHAQDNCALTEVRVAAGGAGEARIVQENETRPEE
jgi:probable phosphoglycerate mutase